MTAFNGDVGQRISLSAGFQSAVKMVRGRMRVMESSYIREVRAADWSSSLSGRLVCVCLVNSLLFHLSDKTSLSELNKLRLSTHREAAELWMKHWASIAHFPTWLLFPSFGGKVRLKGWDGQDLIFSVDIHGKIMNVFVLRLSLIKQQPAAQQGARWTRTRSLNYYWSRTTVLSPHVCVVEVNMEM